MSKKERPRLDRKSYEQPHVRPAGGIFWITNPREQLKGATKPQPSFQNELNKINRYILDRYTWNEQITAQSEDADQARDTSTLMTTMKMGVCAEIHHELQRLLTAHEKPKSHALQQLRSRYKNSPDVAEIIETTWSTIGLNRRPDEPPVEVNRRMFTMIELALVGKVNPKDADILSNLFNDQVYLVIALESMYRAGLVEIAGPSQDFREHIQLMNELIEVTQRHQRESAQHKKNGQNGISNETYSQLLQLCTKLLPQGKRVPTGSIVGDLYALSMEFDRPQPILPNERLLPQQARRALANGAQFTELFKEMWASLPYVMCDPAHPVYPDLVEFLRAYRSVVHVNTSGEGVDYYQQLAVWFVFFDLVNPTIDVVLLMDMLDARNDDLSDVAKYFFEYTKQSVQRYPTSPEEAQHMFVMDLPPLDQDHTIIEHSLDGFRKIFSDADQLFEHEKQLRFQELVRTVIESEERDYISLADQGVILPEQLGINGSQHMIRVSFEENEDGSSYQVAVNLSVDQYSDSEEIEDDDLSYRLRFLVTGEYSSNEIIVSGPWRSSSSPELQRQLEQRFLLLLTQHLMITSQVDRQKRASQEVEDAAQHDVPPTPGAMSKDYSIEKPPKRKSQRRNAAAEAAAHDHRNEATLASSINLAERQKFLPLSLELSTDLQATIERELAKDPAASPYAELLDFVQRYNQSKGLDLVVNSQKVRTSPGTFRLRTYDEGILDDYRFFYERDDGGIGRITRISYRDKNTYK